MQGLHLTGKEGMEHWWETIAVPNIAAELNNFRSNVQQHIKAALAGESVIKFLIVTNESIFSFN